VGIWISKLAQYVEEVFRVTKALREGIDPEKTDTPWFRGAKDCDDGLVPGAYWRKNVNEQDLVVEFMSQAPQYVAMSNGSCGAENPRNRWEWYFLMQHYGLPTRLLDWTENALAGLFFALWREGPQPCVWVLDASQFNEKTVGDCAVFSPPGKFSEHWLPYESEGQKVGCAKGERIEFLYLRETYTNEKPIAVFAARRNQRIIAQQGTFTVHGSDTHSISDLFPPGTSPLDRIDVEPAARKTLLAELEMCGVTELRLFPELDKLAPYIKSRFGIEQ
jgi:hypothetical protein